MARRRILEAAIRIADDLLSGSLFSGGRKEEAESPPAAPEKNRHLKPEQFSPEIKNTLEVMVGKYVNDLLSQQRDLINMHDKKVESMIGSQDMKVRAMITDQDTKVDSRLEGHNNSMRNVLAGASLLAMFVLMVSAVIIFNSIWRYEEVNLELAEVRQSQKLVIAEAETAITSLEDDLKTMQKENLEILGAVAAAAGAGVPGAAPVKDDDNEELEEIEADLLEMNEKLKKTEDEARALRQRLAETDSQMQKKLDDMNKAIAPEKPDPEEKVSVEFHDDSEPGAEAPPTARDHFHAGFAEKDPHKKIEHFTKAVKADPKLAIAYNSRGNAYAELGRFGLALADLSSAIELKPMPRYYTDRGTVLNMTGDYNLAIRDFNAALNLDPENAAAYNNRGIAFEKKGDPARAIEDYSIAVSLAPEIPAPHARIVNMLAAAGKKEDALRALEAAARAGFNKPDLLDPALLKQPEFKTVLDKIASNSAGGE